MLLKEFLYRNKLKYEEFSSICGIAVSTLRTYVELNRIPRAEYAKKIIEATKGQVSAEDLGLEVILRIPYKKHKRRNPDEWHP
jgi:DNA-binding transcriptional regulator YdaS (Cro superfamily)